jgi:biotin synthase-like enzyme
MGNKMITKTVNNIIYNKYEPKDIKDFFAIKKEEEVEKIYEIAKDIQESYHHKICYESNIYYPLIYQIEDNCPTCGYRTPESRQKYTEEFIIRSVEYRLGDIDQYPISGINVVEKNSMKIRELLIILNCLRNKNLNVNVKIQDYQYLKYIEGYDISSIIFETSLNKTNNFNRNNDEKNDEHEMEVVKFIKENMKLKTTYYFLINYNEDYVGIFQKIREIEKYDFDTIEIRGFDPFIDSPEEYNPQYSKEYILRIITLLRITFPDKELKIQYASNGNNFIEDFIKYGINTITGIYTPQMNLKLQNIDVMNIGKKM